MVVKGSINAMLSSDEDSLRPYDPGKILGDDDIEAISGFLGVVGYGLADELGGGRDYLAVMQDLWANRYDWGIDEKRLLKLSDRIGLGPSIDEVLDELDIPVSNGRTNGSIQLPTASNGLSERQQRTIAYLSRLSRSLIASSAVSQIGGMINGKEVLMKKEIPYFKELAGVGVLVTVDFEPTVTGVGKGASSEEWLNSIPPDTLFRYNPHAQYEIGGSSNFVIEPEDDGPTLDYTDPVEILDNMD